MNRDQLHLGRKEYSAKSLRFFSIDTPLAF
jgi:hypothetical protein